MKKLSSLLQDKLAASVAAMGCEFIGSELTQQGHRALFRVYIDKPTGVTSEDCTQVSRQVGAMLDVEDSIHGQYVLEVSSPGIDRPLFTIQHYQQHIGSRVKVRLHAPIDGRRQYKGVLERVEGENIHLLMEEEKVAVILPFSAIEKANIIGEVRL